eukprot:CAMPEP_0114499352 /NCGR_PEP_ID=MMETSP0109-20121206/7372_1 /TAXON_ID=29199 /ORGANISM="Chlorarachnion reptans, Strain CCCM449" /LENGTH=456 /DNA_ID=CAMNT_0001676915 /DNA_START=71 /DNA_END=1438 /DNA_ORIENTATION=-
MKPGMQGNHNEKKASKTRYLEGLAGLRGISSVVIVLHHVFTNHITYGADRFIRLDELQQPPFLFMFNLRNTVSVFFFLTGFLALYQWRRKWGRAKLSFKYLLVYWTAKALRFLPVILVGCAVHLLFTPRELKARDHCSSPSQSIPNLMFYENLRYYVGALWQQTTKPSLNLCMPEMWSVATQYQFHILLPLLGMLSRPILYLTPILNCVAGPLMVKLQHELGVFDGLASSVGTDEVFRNCWYTVCCVPWVRGAPLLVGVCTAEYFMKRGRDSCRWWRQSAVVQQYLGPAACVLLFLANVIPYSYDLEVSNYLSLAMDLSFRGVFSAVLLSILVLAVVQTPGEKPIEGGWFTKVVTSFLGWRGWEWPARLSFGLYVVHPPVIFALCKAFTLKVETYPPGSLNLLVALFERFLLVMLLSVPLAWVCRKCVEIPSAAAVKVLVGAVSSVDQMMNQAKSL